MNKPIIIDGVDVSGCKDYDDGVCVCPDTTVLSCETEPNCYFKQLQRLKAENGKLLNIITEGRAENKRIIKECRDLERENIALKQALEDIREVVGTNRSF